MQKIVKSGVSGLDSILYGGIPQGNTVIVEGHPGTGKTILGMQFLYYGAINYDEPGIYITFEEFPDQIYKDMKAFGWDIRQLEQQNKIRVITLSPDVLMDQIIKPDGLFERLVKDIGCKRIVIDSISLFQFYYSSLQEQRKVIYSLRNILRKFSLTSLLIKEYTAVEEEQVSFINYLVDGVIKLHLQPYMGNYRQRTLEVTKMRGRNIQEGEHLYRITDQGVHLIPALSMIEDEIITSEDHVVPTGITKIDRILGGGIHDGSSFIIDTNSKSNYRYIIASIQASRLKAGEKIVILLSGLTTIPELKETFKHYDIDLDQIVREERILFIDHYRRPVPENYYQKVMINVNGLNDSQYKQALREQVIPLVKEGLERGEKWFVFYDLNTIISQRGIDFVKRYYAEEVATINALGMSMVTLCNFKELGEQTASFIERCSNGVIRTWVDGVYQYLQITKTPNGNNSEPLIVEKIDSEPFIRLV